MEAGREVEALLGLGASMGDRARALRLAAFALHGGGVRVLRASRMVWSAPAGGVAGRPFLNAVLLVRTALTPRELLQRARSIESRLGRRPTRRWADRVLDVDLLQYGDLSLDEADLLLPHPRIAERPFVLQPLLEVAPGAIDPRSGRPWRCALQPGRALPFRGVLPGRWVDRLADRRRSV